MNKFNVILFFTIFFTLYGLINFYVFVRGWQSLPPESALRVPYAATFWILALSFIVGRFLERVAITPFSTVLIWVGSFWLAALAYFTLAALVIDILRLVNIIAPFFPSFVTRNISQAKLVISGGLVLVVMILLAVGYVNARNPKVRELSLHVPKSLDSLKSLNIAVASDIHLGTIVGSERLDRIVDLINDLEPDLVLFPGDVFDEDLCPVIKKNLGERLRMIKARLGVFAITGNHEYIGGVEEACRYMADHNITVLRDSAVKVDGGLFLVGREDLSISQFAGKKRKPLSDLMEAVDKRNPIILMDHQPFRLNEAAEHGADLQLSGHTHHGQIWPFHFITNAIYEVSWGYLKKGNTHVYVSSGVGTWGPPVRLGNRPEIMNLKLSFGPTAFR
ncbi:MAG: metallophosphoesterase [Ignavibacteria bacterium]|nr:metallophosphoesterase [Ignavibacteria bacterium]